MFGNAGALAEEISPEVVTAVIAVIRRHRSMAKENTPLQKVEQNMSITYNAYTWPHGAAAVNQERSAMNLNRIVVQPRLGLLNSENLCAELGVSPRTVRRWTRAGQLPQPHRLGRSCYWNIDEVRASLTHRSGAK